MYNFYMKKLFWIVVIVVALVGAAMYFTNYNPFNSASDEVAVVEGIEALEIVDIESLLAGMWVSQEDEKSVIIFNSNGTARNIYDGEDRDEGTWELSRVDGVDGRGSFVSLKRVIEGEVYKYAVWEVGKTDLVINYTTRGNTLSYKRVDEATSQNWLSQTNSEYGFNFSYPPTWNIQEIDEPQEPFAVYEAVIAEPEYGMWRGSVTIRVFANEEKQTVGDWWGEWLSEEDTKEVACREEYGDESPCLFLRGLVEWEKDTTLAGEKALTVGLFRFDHEEECTYSAHGAYIYGICSAGNNPNDPQADSHKAIADRVMESFKYVE